ncbi:MAG: methyltransferase regulatory domain-containing protein [Pseudomonadota bacterium]
MSDWTAGYVAEIGYTFGYYAELNPLRLKLMFLNQGLVYPEVGAACELGFGQGLSTNFHAAASVTTWHGTDFNPSQAGFAHDLANAAGTDAKLYDEAFSEFAARQDLPQFDYIGLHGIWTWVSNENRAVIVEFIRTRLKVGGVVYISYNTQPGWGAFAPMRHLLCLHAQIEGAVGEGTIGRVDGAFEFADKLLATNPIYVQANPKVAERFKTVKGQNRHYVAHEYFNRDWLPMHFADIADWLETAKLQFACSAHPMDHVEGFNMTGEQQELLKSIGNPILRESARDFITNQQFRRDYWVKGRRPLNAVERMEALHEQKMILVTERASIALKVPGPAGEAQLNEGIYKPLLDLMADHKPRTLGQLEAALKEQGIDFGQILQSAIVLSGLGHFAAVQSDAVIAKVRKQTEKINLHLMRKARGDDEVEFLASPVTGGGVSVAKFHQLFLLALAQGKRQPPDWAEFAWAVVKSQGRRLIKDGKAIVTEEENYAELVDQANTFAKKRLPILKALMVA